jgi:hypothetical protein
MNSDQSKRVAAAAWPWREAVAPKDDGGASRRRSARIEAGIMCAVAAVFTWLFHKPIVAIVICCVATVVLVGGLFVPPLYEGFKKAGLALGKGVGVFLSWILLVPFFYICFPIGRLIFALGRKNPLQRGYLRDAPTYWGVKKPANDLGRYRKQF